MTISKLTPADFDAFIALICALADYEKLSPPNTEARERLYVDAFSPRPRYEAFLAKNDEGKAIAYCIIFETYSSFLAKPTLYLEDIFVLPDHRRDGVGQQLIQHLVTIAQNRGCGRMEWAVLDWNKPAITFYDKLGAKHQKEWYSYRLTEDQFPSITEGIVQ